MTYTRYTQRFGEHIAPLRPEQEQELASLIVLKARHPHGLSAVYDLLTRCGDQHIYNGAYAIFSPEAAHRFTGTCLAAFPAFRGHIIVLARDWLGYLYAADFSRMQADKPTMVLFDVNTGDMMTTNLDIEQFHESAVLDDPEMCFQLSVYSEWTETHPPLMAVLRCIGYTIPLALGGTDAIG